MTDRVGKYDMTIVQGSDTNNISITPKESDGSPINLTNYTAKVQLRKDDNSVEVLDELTTENSRITITEYDVEGVTFWKITLLFPSATTRNYTVFNAVYNLEIYSDSGIVTRLLEGEVTVSPEVVR